MSINSLFLHFLDPKIKEAIALRRQITEMQAVTVEDVEAQDRMLREANEKIDRLKCAADFLIAAEFTPGSAADKRAARDDAAIKVAVHFNDSDLPTFRREAQKALNGQVTFHWPLEFPEVMVERGGFDAFVGNPPFMGCKYFKPSFGDSYFPYLSGCYPGSPGRSDLCAFFFRRADCLLRTNGCCGLIATNTIAQGDTQQFALSPLIKPCERVYRTAVEVKWPGVAAVYVTMVFWSRKEDGNWKRFVDGVEVDHISEYLQSTVRELGKFKENLLAIEQYIHTSPNGRQLIKFKRCPST
jgi:hypothetical protein